MILKLLPLREKHSLLNQSFRYFIEAEADQKICSVLVAFLRSMISYSIYIKKNALINQFSESCDSDLWLKNFFIIH